MNAPRQSRCDRLLAVVGWALPTALAAVVLAVSGAAIVGPAGLLAAAAAAIPAIARRIIRAHPVRAARTRRTGPGRERGTTHSRVATEGGARRGEAA